MVNGYNLLLLLKRLGRFLRNDFFLSFFGRWLGVLAISIRPLYSRVNDKGVCVGHRGIAKYASATVQDALASLEVGREHHDTAAGQTIEVLPTGGRRTTDRM